MSALKQNSRVKEFASYAKLTSQQSN